MSEQKIVKLSDKDITLYALYLLGGWQKRIHTEDVALKCYELAPSKFSWVKYPQYPDLAPARFALEAAKKPSHNALVKGESERKRTAKNIGGWMLTEDGVQWISANIARIEQSLGKHLPMGDRLLSDRRLNELLESKAFKKFEDSGEQAEISHAEFAESLICTVNTKREILNDRLDQLYSTAENLRRLEIKKYVNFCRKNFAAILGGKTEVENDKV
ncbi:MAG: hypothetical protein FJ013_02455 [Chloroflexi bacterium]|nr:hypothetical protein [Chloroflexota bacterium]MBM4453427.1 hypothetical protein [Chloroflexota bacterium]